MDYIGYAAEGLKQKPSESMTSGRFFASIVLHEGPEMVRVVNDLLGSGPAHVRLRIPGCRVCISLTHGYIGHTALLDVVYRAR